LDASVNLIKKIRFFFFDFVKENKNRRGKKQKKKSDEFIRDFLAEIKIIVLLNN
jgi:hypothetical protein